MLVLEDGGSSPGNRSARSANPRRGGVFHRMSGYQETLTDPSYHRQIVVATAPQIGNTGWNTEDSEAAVIGSGWPATRCGIRHRG
ncbi:carbamoyl-phosphate synthase small chain, CPSase domain protein, partial [Mycobacterium xenopi 4042]